MPLQVDFSALVYTAAFYIRPNERFYISLINPFLVCMAAEMTSPDQAGPLDWPRTAPDHSSEAHPNEHIRRGARGHPGASPNRGKTGANKFLGFAGLSTVE